MTAQSGFPTPVTSNLDTTGTGITSRPNQIAGQNGNLPADQRTWKHWFNTAAFTQAHYGSFGTSPRTERLPPARIGQLRFLRQQSSSASRSAAACSSAPRFFNLFNHFNPDPQTVDTNINSATFGIHRRRRLRHHDTSHPAGSKTELLTKRLRTDPTPKIEPGA